MHNWKLLEDQKTMCRCLLHFLSSSSKSGGWWVSECLRTSWECLKGEADHKGFWLLWWCTEISASSHSKSYLIISISTSHSISHLIVSISTSHNTSLNHYPKNRNSSFFQYPIIFFHLDMFLSIKGNCSPSENTYFLITFI